MGAVNLFQVRATSFRDEDLLEIIKAAREAIKRLKKRKEVSGYLSVRDGYSCQSLLTYRFGFPMNEDPYFSLSLEKGKRLWKNFLKSSWQNRDPNKNQWGGAIRAGQSYVMSFSGLDELEDEAISLFVALKLKWIDLEGAKEIADISKNKIFKKILKK